MIEIEAARLATKLHEAAIAAREHAGPRMAPNVDAYRWVRLAAVLVAYGEELRGGRRAPDVPEDFVTAIVAASEAICAP